MATYYVNSGASGANNGSSWTDAYTAFGSAVTAATSAGDIIKVHYTHAEALAANTTYTFAQSVIVIAVDKDSSDAPTVMGTTGYIGHTSTSYSITLSGTYRIYMYGITFRTAGSSGVVIQVGANNQHLELESCYIWSGSTSATNGLIRINATNSGNPGYCRLTNCTLRFGHATQSLDVNKSIDWINTTISSAGSAPTTLINASSATADLYIGDSDLSYVTGTLLGNFTGSPVVLRLWHCKLGAGVTVCATQSNWKTRQRAYVYDCSSGDTHGIFGYYDGLGSCVTNSSIYVTAGAAGQSWLITTTSSASYWAPFVTPWIDWYNTGASSITPYFDMVRSGSSTAYKDDEVWAEFSAKTTSGYTIGTVYSDRCSIANEMASSASNQATSSLGASDWTGESGTAWFGKCDSGSAFTPAEVGHIRGRIIVGKASVTDLYLDPQIKT